ncbi:hypothetical protein [Candidatus Uabimicrobium amorphum]|uniref:Uncharacterized protein n=1 Tax=Uabimicrobium amorphum TaxID=2596890 RepID=A0A5S9ITZ8_UABAM|nr:hypothetical protein [Candidatus Uabimicrobium amorphum]BBM86575.1 hypothetical protein UABAM_04961 [Candidatus Uabimicrobium amorphum]
MNRLMIVVLLISIGIAEAPESFQFKKGIHLKPSFGKIIVCPTPKLTQKPSLAIDLNVPGIVEVLKKDELTYILGVDDKHQSYENINKMIDTLYQEKLIVGITFLYTNNNNEEYYFLPIVVIKGIDKKQICKIKNNKYPGLRYWQGLHSDPSSLHCFMDERYFPIRKKNKKQFFQNKLQAEYIGSYSLLSVTESSMEQVASAISIPKFPKGMDFIKKLVTPEKKEKRNP